MNVYVREVAGALARSGLRVDILTSSQTACEPGVTQLNEHLRVIRLAADHRANRRRLRLPRYDVVHSHYWQSAAPARAVNELSGARHIHTFHTCGHVKNKTLAPNDVPEPDDRLQAEQEIVADADALIVATEAEKTQLLEYAGGSAGRIHVTAPGVDTRVFRSRDGRAALPAAPADRPR
jgi:D-inositol-3-phosphate glycosyltransferase